MARISCRSCVFVRRVPPVVLSVLALLLLLPADASAVLRPLEGRGNFAISVDVVNRWRGEDVLDVLVLVEVANADLSFRELDGGLQGRLRVEVELEALDGRLVAEKRPVRTRLLTVEEAASPTLFQVFGVILEDVPFRSGRVRCAVYDVNERKEGLFNQMRKESRASAAAGVWAADDGPRAPAGLALGQPLFLAHAPLRQWRPGAEAATPTGWLHDYMHPARRYGLEQDRLQLFVPVWPPLGGVPADADSQGLQVTITSLDLDYAITDTIDFDNTGRAALAAGRPAGLVYELDVNLLPEGSFLLGLAPLDRRGRGTVTQFDVIWRLSALARRPGQLRGEGRTLFHGPDLSRFLAASAAEQEALLTDYWDSVNPDPESPVNEAYLEYQYRLAFVRQFLGGFDEFGASDARGEVFLALGMPDEVKSQHMPQNFRDQDDARINVFQRFAPDREGTMARGNTGSGDPTPYGSNDPIPQPWSHRAENQRAISQQSSTHLQGFELWEYDNGGKPLWESRFSRSGMGQRFLFVDRNGTGEFYLESSNIVQGEE